MSNSWAKQGGSTMFKDFGRRLQRDIKRRCDERISHEMAKAIDVSVVSHLMQVCTPPMHPVIKSHHINVMVGHS